MSELEFTGERLIPGRVDKNLYHEHLARYLFAGHYVKDKMVLDFGCGSGYGSDVLKKAGAAKVVGIDISTDAVEYAQAHYGGDDIEFIAADCRKTPFLDNHFDLVISFEVLEHIEDYKAYLAEARRILRKDGFFLVSTPNKKTYTDEREGFRNPFHVREFYLDEFVELLKEYFPHSEIYGQFRTEGMLIKRASPADSKLRDLRGDVETLEGTDGDGFLETSPYFIAVCTAEPSNAGIFKDYSLLVEESDAIRKLSIWAKRLDEESKAKGERIIALQKECEERTAWALKLDGEVRKTREKIASLQKEYEERTQWAVRLDEELKQSRERIATLLKEMGEKTQWATSEIKTRDERIAAAENELQKKCWELIEVDGSLKAKCLELAAKEDELVRVCELKETGSKQLREEIEKRDRRIGDLLNSMSWKITALLRALYGLFRK
jgi:SAM-dependent methyltransferase/uncharacterized protein YeeX (DUF496 family)